MKRVCIFCEMWESGGIEAFLCNVLCHMDLSGLEIDLVAAQLRESVFTQALKDRGIRFYELSGKANEVFANHRVFRRLLGERQYHILHLNVFHGLSLAYARMAKAAGVPVRIAHSHGADLQQSPTRWLKLRLHSWAKQKYGVDCTHLWACSELAAEFLFTGKNRREKGWQFIPNGIKTEKFRFNPAARSEVRKELGLTDEFVIGHVGRLCQEKNQHFLLEVFQEVVRQRPNGRLLLIGGGADLPRLKEKAADLDIADKVIFYGTTPHVECLYQAMDVFAFPSLFEGLGIASIEAQAAGLPVVCSDRIPKEAFVTPWAIRVKLSAGPAEWADIILNADFIEGRESAVGRVTDAGFDIRTVAKHIEEVYLCGESKNFSDRPGLQGGTVPPQMFE